MQLKLDNVVFELKFDMKFRLQAYNPDAESQVENYAEAFTSMVTMPENLELLRALEPQSHLLTPMELILSHYNCSIHIGISLWLAKSEYLRIIYKIPFGTSEELRII